MHDKYENPLCSRYASSEIQYIFSDDNKFKTWRKLWIALAESERDLGLPISAEQISQMRQNVENINYDVAQSREREIRHDVMAHIFAFGEQCPLAKPIIHLGATSCYVGDNTDIILTKQGLLHIKKLLINALNSLYKFADKHKALPTLGYTHFQPAQPTTVGKRATLWILDLMMDIQQLDFIISDLKLLGCKGTTGTQASFLELFEGDHQKVTELDNAIAKKMGFDKVYPVSGQTYSRKVDYFVMSTLCAIAQSAHKFSNDIRLLCHLKEFDEPFEAQQVGSSAMAYKRNPMRCERIASLSRYIMVNSLNPALTAANQWFERTLDDSANKRISTPEAFLAVDSILSLYINVINGVTVYEQTISKHLQDEIPFMATENILMYCVKMGGDRQQLHEAIRSHAVEAAKQVKLNGAQNDLIERIISDECFDISERELNEIISVDNFTGCACRQTEEFLKDVRAFLNQNAHYISSKEVEIKC